MAESEIELATESGDLAQSRSIKYRLRSICGRAAVWGCHSCQGFRRFLKVRNLPPITFDGEVGISFECQRENDGGSVNGTLRCGYNLSSLALIIMPGIMTKRA